MLNENIEFHSKLNNKIWNGFELKPEIHTKLLEIADTFNTSLDVPNLEVYDIVFTGSLANYNYTSQSDIDLHLVVDFNTLNISPEEFIQKYFNSKKNEFNQKHNIKIYGYPVELYVEDIKSPAKATGRYSLKNRKWLSIPKGLNDEVYDVTNEQKYKIFVNEIDSLGENADKDDAAIILANIYDMRRNGLEENGELALDNLIFKELRNNGYIDKVRDIIIKSIDDELSLVSNEKINESAKRKDF